jgi:magnesium chelatase subunit D
MHDALIAAMLFAKAPTRLGGMVIKAYAGPVRDRYLGFLTSHLAPGMPFRKLPLSIQDERLLGGLDISATLNSGKPVLSKGLLAEVHGGILLVPMAERMGGPLAARLAGAMDRGQIIVQREGLSADMPAEFGLVLLDESVADDEAVPTELLDRIAFHVDLRETSSAQADAEIKFFEDALLDAHADDVGLRWSATDPSDISDDLTQALCATGMALGIDSIRAVILARRTAELAGKWFGRAHTAKEDVALAARLVLSPRATMMPMDPSEPPPQEPEEPPSPDDSEDPPDDPSDQDESNAQDDLENLDDVILEAAKAAIPAGLLAQLLSDQRLIARGSGSGKSGAQKKGGSRGRPLGSRPGLPAGKARLSIIDTLRAAAPWQKIRRRESRPIAKPRLAIRAEDFRIKRFKERSETTTIFVVDASGSSAIHRLAEAKGAVELLLADCYVRRDQVAVIAFRGKQAEIILPPTRSLVRAKRGLSGLPGGGGTPLAMAIDASMQLALSIARKGETPLVVMLTDGKANLDRDGNPGREKAQADAMLAAQQFAAAGLAAMIIDTSPQPSEAAQKLSQQMHARYMPLPHAGAAQVSQAVKRMV